MNKRILLAEDNRALRIVLKMALSDKFQVVDVPDGQRLQEELEQGEFDLIISDLNLPNCTGPDAVRKGTRIYNKTGHLKNGTTKILVITGLDPDDVEVQKARRLPNVIEIVHKPIDIPSLCAKVEALLDSASEPKLLPLDLLGNVVSNVLVISAENEVQRLMTEIFDAGDIQARACKNIHQADSLLLEAKYSMVVLDLLAAQYSSADLSRFLGSENMPPVVVLSPMEEDETQAYLNYPSSVYRVLLHPLSLDEVKELVDEIMCVPA